MATTATALAGVSCASFAHGVAADRPAAPGGRAAGRVDPLLHSWSTLRPAVRPAGAAAPAQPEPGEVRAPVWTPAAPLPAPPARGQHVDVVLSPHPDDETLSLGVWIADAVGRGHRVVVVALGDGRSTGATPRISARLGRTVTRDEIARSRTLELRAAATALGVRPGDVYPARLDDDHGPGGTRITQPEVAAVIRTFAARYPAATFATMSWAAERHPDHLSAGLALRAAAHDGTVPGAVFAVSRLWWTLPAPRSVDVVPRTPAARQRVLRAAGAYARWDPAAHRLAVGSTSVHGQFTALQEDPRDRVHG